jgi:pyruvate-ferredoxin/flavodoxin oxidoreductase
VNGEQKTDADFGRVRADIAALKAKLADIKSADDAKRLVSVADALLKRSQWIMGRDGWAYDRSDYWQGPESQI